MVKYDTIALGNLFSKGRCIMTTIKDISKLAGVSKSTVSRYLNNGSVSKHTAEKIKKIIDELEYVPNSFAQSLKAFSTNKIGTVIPNFTGITKNISLTAIDEYLKSNSYKMFISNSNDDMEEERKIINSILSQKMDGIILFASETTQEHIEFIKSLSIPIVVIGQKIEGVHCVIHDDYKAGQVVGRHILSEGHKNVTYFGVGDYDKSVYERFLGVSDVLDKEDVNINYYKVEFGTKTAYDKILDIHSFDKATYYIGATDGIAYGIIKGLRKQNISVPEDVSVSGFGDYDVNTVVDPPLTSVHFPYYEAGRCAAEMLVDILSGKDVPLHKYLEGTLNIRESTKKR